MTVSVPRSKFASKLLRGKAHYTAKRDIICAVMARKKSNSSPTVPTETKRAIIVILLTIIGLFLALSAFGVAGVAGSDAYRLIASLLGVGYFLVPLLFFVLAGNALRPSQAGFPPVKLVAAGVFFIAGLGFIQMVSDQGGLLGSVIAAPALRYLDLYAGLVVLGGGVAIGAGEMLFAPVRQVVAQRAILAFRRDLQIVPAALGDDAGLLGAAALVLSS